METAALLTVTQLPGLYVQPDAGLAVAFDDDRVEELSHTGKTVKSHLTNPTKFPADVMVLVETAKAARRPVGSFVLKPLPVVHLDAGASTMLEYTASSSSSVPVIRPRTNLRCNWQKDTFAKQQRQKNR
jgi:hypothetical protein